MVSYLGIGKGERESKRVYMIGLGGEVVTRLIPFGTKFDNILTIKKIIQ